MAYGKAIKQADGGAWGEVETKYFIALFYLGSNEKCILWGSSGGCAMPISEGAE